ncbi:MAG: NifB/NifX family molybdenum-iron cluster-binding protein [Methanomicrobiales archaeon]|nr:NifB/NifX family molybdenum-iron cluster-binding protein [Methanomicrobiales archaeon]MDI6875924.1 NifB/NifX family molybdenum-iron cluster-binding protein [Methanomicrobiales archaeon]
MIIGIAKDGDRVSQHFGRCEGYRLYRIEDGKILEQKDILNPGHEPGVLPRLLADHGVNVVIAGGMGPKAADLFCQQGMEVFTGVSGSLDDVAHQFILGELREGRNICHH